MVGFASTVFGEKFDESSVITESRLTRDEWTAGAADQVAALGLTPRRLARPDLPAISAAVEALGPNAEARDQALTVLGALYDADAAIVAERVGDAPDALLLLIQTHPLVYDLAGLAEQAVHLNDLAEALFPNQQSAQLRAERTSASSFSRTSSPRSATSEPSLAGARSVSTCTCGSVSSPGSIVSPARPPAICGATTAR